ncbi:MAG: hypothetical protein CMH55_04745 [Myxococcales bacterium]|nr:hypothetical protein [Myxococcales bacterium]
MSSSRKKVVGTIALIIGIFALVGGAGAVIGRRPPPPKKESKGEQATPVITAQAKRQDFQPTIHGQGTIAPISVAQLTAQATGQVVWLSPKLRRGASVKAGELLVKIDERDYQARLSQAVAGVASAQSQVALAQARHETAKSEWAIAHPGKTASELVLQLPQLRAAEAALQSAKANVQLATLALERCQLKAPLDAVIQTRQVSRGDLVGPGRPLASLLPVREAEITVSLAREELAKLGEDLVGRKSSLRFQVGAKPHVIDARLVRVLGELDRVGRMSQVIIQPENGVGAELPFGAFVHVEIQGQLIKDVIEVPAEALQNDDTVYLMKGDRLVTRQVQLVHREPKRVLIAGDLQDGDSVVVSKVRGLVEGMLIKAIGTRTMRSEESGSTD